MGGTGDLAGDDQAFFTSTSMQSGVPMMMHDAYIDVRVFSLADAIQTERIPTLIEGGHSSFVQYLEKYVFATVFNEFRHSLKVATPHLCST